MSTWRKGLPLNDICGTTVPVSVWSQRVKIGGSGALKSWMVLPAMTACVADGARLINDLGPWLQCEIALEDESRLAIGDAF